MSSSFFPLAPSSLERRRPLAANLLLAAAVALPLLLTGIGAWLSWRSTWREAEADVQRTADAAAEYARRVLDAHRTAVDRVNDLLRSLTDEEIRAREGELHQMLRTLVTETPQLQTAYVGDRFGRLLVSASLYPVPREADFSDREFHQILSASDQPAVAITRVYRGRLENNLFFAVARPRRGTGNLDRSPGTFDGQANVSVDLEEIGAGLRQISGRPGDALALVRTDGEILSRSISLPGQLPVRLSPDSGMLAAMRAGVERALVVAPSGVDGVVRIGAYRRVAGWPVYVSAARRRSDVVQAWLATLWALLGVAVPATLALFALSLVVRRRERALIAANAGLEERVAERTAALASSEARLRLATTGAGIGTWEYDLRTGLWILSAEAIELLGTAVSNSDGKGWLDTVHADDRAAVKEAWRQLLNDGAPYEAEYRTAGPAPDGGDRWLLSRGQVERDSSGVPVRAAGVLVDVTERRRQEERLVLLAREVDHRAKNALAVVQAALRLTPRRDVASFAEAVEGRVRALARVHSLLAEGRWAGADIRQLIEAELAPFLILAEGEAGGENAPCVDVEGPLIRVGPSAAQSLSLALHELATNATKYGALSVPGGVVRLTWHLDDGTRTLRVRWEEHGGPAVIEVPSRRGFGARVLDASIRGQLGGMVRLDWQRSGLACDIEVPIVRLSENGHPGPTA
jgi:PAS domain S-box-containing protein